MIVLNSRLEQIVEPDAEAWVIAKLTAMGFKESDTIQVNL